MAGKTRASAFAELFDRLLEDVFDVIVVSAKRTDREGYLRALEAETGGTVRTPDELPLEVETESGVVFAYTDPTYQYGMESVLLNVVADTVIGSDLPADHGWLVQNTETMSNISRAFREQRPVTSTYVHVDGDVPATDFSRSRSGPRRVRYSRRRALRSSRCRRTPSSRRAGPAGVSNSSAGLGSSGSRKRRTDCSRSRRSRPTRSATAGSTSSSHVTGPNGRWRQNRRRRSSPTVFGSPRDESGVRGNCRPGPADRRPGDRVDRGDVVAGPRSDGISIPQHASIDGTVTAVTDSNVEITADDRR